MIESKQQHFAFKKSSRCVEPPNTSSAENIKEAQLSPLLLWEWAVLNTPGVPGDPGHPQRLALARTLRKHISFGIYRGLLAGKERELQRNGLIEPRFTVTIPLECPAAFLDLFFPILQEQPAEDGSWDWSGTLSWEQLGKVLTEPGKPQPQWYDKGLFDEFGCIQSVHKKELTEVSFQWEYDLGWDHSQCPRCLWRPPPGMSLLEALKSPEATANYPSVCSPTRRVDQEVWTLMMEVPRMEYRTLF